EHLAISGESGDRSGIAVSLTNLGNVAKGQGDYAAARTLFEQSLAIQRELGEKRSIAIVLEALASVNVRDNKPEPAPRLWAATAQLREEIGSPRTPKEQAEYDRDVAAAHRALGEAAFSAAWEEGRAMTLEQAIEYALAEEG